MSVRSTSSREAGAAKAVWYAGLAGIVGVVLLSPLISFLLTAAAFGSARRAGPSAHANATAAVNWQLTYLGAHLLLLGTQVTVATVVGTAGFASPQGVILALLVALTVTNLVISVLGGLRASNVRVFSVPAIPFLRPADQGRSGSAS